MSKNQKLALVGYGKMGHLVEQLAPEYNFDVVLRLNRSNGITAEALHGVDAAVEFSTPEAAPENLQRLALLKIPTVTGTTGWIDHLPAVKAAVAQSGGGLVWSPNFSAGVAIFRKLAAFSAQLLRDETEYGAWAWEIHHDAKKDAPSGTLMLLVQAMKDAGYRRHIDTSSSRAGKHPGTHEIGFDSAADTITLRHTARSRDGFARGALKSARWILSHKGVYTFEEVLFGKE
jgi:4-hydroxy-tetrahydrodipicolinate reductase